MKKQKRRIYVLPTMMLAIMVVAGMVGMAPSSSAEDISPIDDEITITVDSACTMGQTTTYTNPSLNPGETNTIGTSRISAYCNDASGYDIYAIGYTNGEYGNTSMQSTESSHTIPTGLSGEGSYWHMSLTPGTNTTTPFYIPTITSNFTSPSTIPNDYTKVATYPSTTIPQSEDPLSTGSYFTTTYTSHISTTQPAGVYTGQVQYVMVHPQGAPAPEIPNIGQLTYMQDFASLSEQEKANIVRNTDVGIQYTLIDNRDDKVYYVSKLADGNIWMTQNLDFDIDSAKTYTPADTDISVNWKPVRSTTTGNAWTTGPSGYTIPHSYDPGDRYWNGAVINSDGDISNRTTTSGDTHYHIGNYYIWTAAVAMNDSSGKNSGDMNQSICPAGWRLPTYEGNKSFLNLQNAQHFTSGTRGNIQNSPAYFVWGGFWVGGSRLVGRGGRYWSSVVGSSNVSYLLDFYADGYLAPQSNANRDYGFSVRCVAR